MDEKYGALLDYFRAVPRVAVAFSGGADSTLLLHAAADSGADVRAYYVTSAFQPAWERRDAERFSADLGVPLTLLELDVLALEQIVKNDAERCYHCKRAIFSKIGEQARADGYTVLVDGTNASDDAADRPGMRALLELSVLSPLRACGLTKMDIRRLSRKLGLPSADKPAYACLATRIPTDRRIEAALLARVERAEDLLREQGFCDFRVRVRGSGVLLQLRSEDQDRFMRRQRELLPPLQACFPVIELDPAPRRGES